MMWVNNKNSKDLNLVQGIAAEVMLHSNIIAVAQEDLKIIT